jgi:hypothetical protein
MAVIRLTPGLGWRLAGVFSLMAVVSPSAQSPRPAPATVTADLADRVPTVSASSVSTWTRLLAAGGRLSAQERLVVLDADGSVLAQVDGGKRSVLVPEALTARLCSEPVGATLIHNHPEVSSFSTADLEALTQLGVHRIVAITADGTTFEATAGSRFSDVWAPALRAELPARVHARVTDEALRAGLPSDALAAHEPHLVALILRRLGVLDYRVSPSVTARVAYDRYRIVMGRVVDAETDAAIAPAPTRSRR